MQIYLGGSICTIFTSVNKVLFRIPSKIATLFSVIFFTASRTSSLVAPGFSWGLIQTISKVSLGTCWGTVLIRSKSLLVSVYQGQDLLLYIIPKSMFTYIMFMPFFLHFPSAPSHTTGFRRTFAHRISWMSFSSTR